MKKLSIHIPKKKLSFIKAISALIILVTSFFLIEFAFFKDTFGSYNASILLVISQIFSLVFPFSLWFIFEGESKKFYKKMLAIMLILVSLGTILLIKTLIFLLHRYDHLSEGGLFSSSDKRSG
ncbi:MAG: hypothetical protein L0207_01035 [Chlamydiae bacterium]|nr:hypothetical protein [Chlamydiota bacterium]